MIVGIIILCESQSHYGAGAMYIISNPDSGTRARAGQIALLRSVMVGMRGGRLARLDPER